MSRIGAGQTTTDQAARRHRMSAVAAATAGTVIDLGYVRLIAEQGTGLSSRIAFVAAFIAGMAILALVGAILLERRPNAAQAALLATATGFAAIGFLSLFSIGGALLLAALLTGFAIPFAGVPARWVVAPVAGSMAVLVLGMMAT